MSSQITQVEGLDREKWMVHGQIERQAWTCDIIMKSGSPVYHCPRNLNHFCALLFFFYFCTFLVEFQILLRFHFLLPRVQEGGKCLQVKARNTQLTWLGICISSGMPGKSESSCINNQFHGLLWKRLTCSYLTELEFSHLSGIALYLILMITTFCGHTITSTSFLPLQKCFLYVIWDICILSIDSIDFSSNYWQNFNQLTGLSF